MALYSIDGLQLIGVLFLFWSVLIAADPEANRLNSGCSTVKSTNATLLNNNLNAVLQAVRVKIVSSGFATAEQVIGADPVYGLGQCRKDKTPSDCLKRITVAEKQIRNCSAVSGGRVIYDGCFLRYESNNFYAQATGPGNTQFCGATKPSGDTNQFSEIAEGLISDLIIAAPKTQWLFAAQSRELGASNSTIYALASCLRSINESGCSECLGIAEGNIRNCVPQAEGRAVDVGCYLRYATYPFFPSNATTDLTALLSSGHKNKSRTWIIIVGVVGGTAVILIMTLIARRYFFRLYTIPSHQRQVDTLIATELRGPVDFDFKILRDATNKFDTLEIVDETMGDEYDKEEVLRMIQLGLLCTQASVAQRPSMSEIVAMLVSKRDINNLQTTVPMTPGYTVRITNSEAGTSSSTSNATLSTSLTAR